MKEKRWKPESGELYYFISTAGDIIPERFYNYEAGSRSRFLHGNVFKTKAAAEAAAEKVKSLLLSLHSEPVANCNQLPKLTEEVFDRPDCPEWAQYAAVDENGRAVLFEHRPTIAPISKWWNRRAKYRLLDGLFDASDWKNSPIERPENRVNWDEIEEILCNSKLTFKEKKQELPDWCKVGQWVYSTVYKEYVKLKDIDEFEVEFDRGAYCAVSHKAFLEDYKPAHLRPYNAEEMKSLVGKVVCGSEGKTFLVVAYSPNTVLFGDFLHTPEDLTLDIYKFPDGSPCGVLEHFEEGEWVK